MHSAVIWPYPSHVEALIDICHKVALFRTLLDRVSKSLPLRSVSARSTRSIIGRCPADKAAGTRRLLIRANNIMALMNGCWRLKWKWAVVRRICTSSRRNQTARHQQMAWRRKLLGEYQWLACVGAGDQWLVLTYHTLGLSRAGPWSQLWWMEETGNSSSSWKKREYLSGGQIWASVLCSTQFVL